MLVLARGPVGLLTTMGVDLLRDETEQGNVDRAPEEEERKVEDLSLGAEDVSDGNLLPLGVLGGSSRGVSFLGHG